MLFMVFLSHCDTREKFNISLFVMPNDDIINFIFSFRICPTIEFPNFALKISWRAVTMYVTDSESTHAQNGQNSSKQMVERHTKLSTNYCSTCRYPSPTKRDHQGPKKIMIKNRKITRK